MWILEVFFENKNIIGGGWIPVLTESKYEPTPTCVVVMLNGMAPEEWIVKYKRLNNNTIGQVFRLRKIIG